MGCGHHICDNCAHKIYKWRQLKHCHICKGRTIGVPGKLQQLAEFGKHVETILQGDL